MNKKAKECTEKNRIPGSMKGQIKMSEDFDRVEVENEKRIMKNVRRLLKMPEFLTISMHNWVLYKEIFGVGGTLAKKRCKEIGIKPNEP